MTENKTYRDAIQQISSAPSAKTQRTRILRRLIDARGGWAPLPEIMACAAQYNARILELRRRGFNIENRTEHKNGARHSWFRLIAISSAESQPKPRVPGSSKPKSEWKERPRATGLPLFDLAVR